MCIIHLRNGSHSVRQNILIKALKYGRVACHTKMFEAIVKSGKLSMAGALLDMTTMTFNEEMIRCCSHSRGNTNNSELPDSGLDALS